MEWIEYVEWFVKRNEHIEEDLFGRWISILANDPKKGGAERNI